MGNTKKPQGAEAGELMDGTQGVSKQQDHSTLFLSTPQASWPTCGNSAADQRERLLAAIQERGSISTFESRRDLDIMHPSARIMELKKRGVPLQTVRVPEVSPAGKVHNVARYYMAVKDIKAKRHD